MKAIWEILVRGFEELLPWFYYLLMKGRVRNRIENIQKDFDTEKYADYIALPKDVIDERLSEEHQRAKDLDEKTVKLTMGFGIGAMFISVSSTALLKIMAVEQLIIIFGIMIFISLLYTLIGGFIALGAIRLSTKYGFGTFYRIALKKSPSPNTVTAHQLVLQENSSILRQMRNESAFMNLRNGVVLFFVALAIFVGDMVAQETTDKATDYSASNTCEFYH